MSTLALWIAVGAALFLFARRVRRFVRLFRKGRREHRFDHLPQRVGAVATNVLLQPRLLHERVFGLAHLVIFWACMFFVTSFGWNLVKGLFPFLPIPYSDDVAWIYLPMEFLGAFALAGLLVAALRRYVFTPPRLERTWDATLVLGLISTILLSFLLGQGFKAAGGGHAGPIGRWIGGLFEAESSEAGYVWMSWIHMLVVLGFVAYLPYSKHVHLLAAPFSVFFKQIRPGVKPPASEGARHLEELTWRQILNGVSCAECGRCDRVCPALESGYPLSPKELIHELRLRLFDALDGKSNGLGLDPGALWSCTTCLACMERCPVFNEHVPLLIEMRRSLVAEGEISPQVQEVLVHLARYGNSFGKSPRARARWTRELDFKIKDARKEPVEYLWIVGDYASLDPRVQPATRATARIFQSAGLDFGILYEGERSSGNDVARIGEEGLFESLREANESALARVEFARIVTTDPHTFHALRNEYGTNGTPVLHCTEVVDGLIRRGVLAPEPMEGRDATYHDPCYLGRYNGVYDAPRRVLRAAGVRLREMPRRRATAFCCGGGGGRIWMEDTPGIEERPAEKRVREAAALEGVDTLVVSCPKDLVMFGDALKTTGLEGGLVVRDLMELVEPALAGKERSVVHERIDA